MFLAGQTTYELIGEPVHLNLHTLQLVSLVLIAAFLFLSRSATGHARQTPEGTAFPLKKAVVWARVLALVFYAGLFAYPLWISQRSIPAWLLLLLFAFTMFALYQLPGKIVLTPAAVTQRFWLRAAKVIPYSEVMVVQTLLNGRQTRVLGSNRVAITHTYNHAAPRVFQEELEKHTGKRPVQ